MKRIAIIGAGNMGGAICKGIKDELEHTGFTSSVIASILKPTKTK